MVTINGEWMRWIEASSNSGGWRAEGERGNEKDQVNLRGLGESRELRGSGFRGLQSDRGNERTPRGQEASQQDEKAASGCREAGR